MADLLNEALKRIDDRAAAAALENRQTPTTDWGGLFLGFDINLDDVQASRDAAVQSVVAGLREDLMGGHLPDVMSYLGGAWLKAIAVGLMYAELRDRQEPDCIELTAAQFAAMDGMRKALRDAGELTVRQGQARGPVEVQAGARRWVISPEGAAGRIMEKPA